MEAYSSIRHAVVLLHKRLNAYHVDISSNQYGVKTLLVSEDFQAANVQPKVVEHTVDVAILSHQRLVIPRFFLTEVEVIRNKEDGVSDSITAYIHKKSY